MRNIEKACAKRDGIVVKVKKGGKVVSENRREASTDGGKMGE